MVGAVDLFLLEALALEAEPALGPGAEEGVGAVVGGEGLDSSTPSRASTTSRRSDTHMRSLERESMVQEEEDMLRQGQFREREYRVSR